MYTKTETLELIRKAVEAHPNRRNPKIGVYDGGPDVCVYTSKNGRSHCIAGQLIKDTGATPPKWNVETDIGSLSYGSCDEDYPWLADHMQSTFSRDSIGLLVLAQNIFDGGSISSSIYEYGGTIPDGLLAVTADVSAGPRRWKDALALLEKILELESQ